MPQRTFCRNPAGVCLPAHKTAFVVRLIGAARLAFVRIQTDARLKIG